MSVSTALVQQYYTGILRLTPSTTQVNQLAASSADLNALTTTLLNVASTAVDPIVRMYQAAFNRVPDSTGLTNMVTNYSLNAQNSGTLTTLQIAGQFTGSPEFITNYGAQTTNATSNRVFVSALYTNVLGRPIVGNEGEGWVAYLNGGGSRAVVLQGFADSSEFIIKSTPAVNNFLTGAGAGTATYTGSLNDYTAPTTYTLTTSADTASASSFFGVVNGVTATPTTFTVGDTLTGTGNNATLTLADGGAGNYTLAMPSVATLSNITNLVLAGSGADTITADTSAAGFTAIKNATYTGGSVITATAAAGQNVTATSTGQYTTVGGFFVPTSVATSGYVSVAKANNVVVNAQDSVNVSTATGSVTINITKAAPGSSDTGASVIGAARGVPVPGVVVTGGTTVSVTEAAATISGTTATSLTNATEIKIGVAPTTFANATTGKETITNLTSIATGNVTTKVATTYTDANGLSDVVFGTGSVTAFTNGATTVSLTGAGASTVTDIQTTLLVPARGQTAVAGTSTLTTVSLAGFSGGATITSDAIANLSITDSAAAGTIVLAGSSATKSNTGTLNVSIGNSGATVSAANITNVAVTGVNSAYQAIAGTAVSATSASTLALTAAKATTVSFAGTSAITLGASTLTALTAITSSAAGAVSLGDVSTYALLTSINASTATGALKATIGNSANVGLAITGGAGNDVVTLKAGTYGPTFNTAGAAVNTTINLGTGNDAVYATVGAAITINAGTTIAAGTGTDTVSARLVTAGTAGLFTGFEILDTTGSANLSIVDAALLGAGSVTGISYHGADSTSIAATTDTATIQNLALASTVGITGYTNQAALATGYLQNITQTHIAGAASSAITFAAAPAAAPGAGTGNYSVIGTFTSTGDTTIAINSNGGTYQTGNGINTLTVTGNTLTSITIAGTKAFTLGAVTTDTLGTEVVATASALTLIDGSTATGALTISAGTTNTNAAASNITYTGLTIKGGLGNDTITINAKNGIVNGGAGTDTLTIGSDVSATLNGGAGSDLFNVAAAVSTGNAAANTVMATIGDAAIGDTIQLLNLTTDSFTQAAINVSSAGSLSAAIALASANNSAANVSNVTWFQFAGNTYVVDTVGTAAAATNIAAGDIVVQLTGAVDLSTSTLSTGGVLTIA
jgi:S-layer protein